MYWCLLWGCVDICGLCCGCVIPFVHTYVQSSPSWSNDSTIVSSANDLLSLPFNAHSLHNLAVLAMKMTPWTQRRPILVLVSNVAGMSPLCCSTPTLSPIFKRHAKTGNTNVDDVGTNSIPRAYNINLKIITRHVSGMSPNGVRHGLQTQIWRLKKTCLSKTWPTKQPIGCYPTQTVIVSFTCAGLLLSGGH